MIGKEQKMNRYIKLVLGAIAFALSLASLVLTLVSKASDHDTIKILSVAVVLLSLINVKKISDEFH